VRTAEVILAGRKFVVSSFCWRDVEKLMALYLAIQKAIEERPVNVRALLDYHSTLVEFLFASVHRAQSGVTRDDFADLEPDVLMSAIATAIEISSPSKHSLSQLTGSRPN
jgi:hypothetical protein